MKPGIRQSLLLLATLSTAALLLSGCGRRGLPVPPRERVPQTVEISGYQQGGEILLSWKMPARNADLKSVMNVARADVYRFVEPIGSFTFLTEEEFAERSTIVSTVDFKSDDFGAKSFTVTDPMDFGDKPVLVRYAVRLVNAMGQRSGFSNFVTIETSLRVALAPVNPTVAPSQSALTVSWSTPSENLDRSVTDNILGYNVYRKEGDGAFRLRNEAPIVEARFDDELFEFGKTYTYFVRAVSTVSDGMTVESSDSEIVAITPVDVFPPAPPEAVTIATSLTEISIFFASNLENDIEGYIIYRSENRDEPLDRWIQLNEKLLTTNTFRDEKVDSGKSYHYYVIAIDKRGNRSEPSEVVSETVPTRQ